MAKNTNANSPKETKLEVSANPAAVSFPTDEYGLTTDLKAAMLAVASRLVGSPDKKELLDATLAVGLAHIEAKYAEDKATREADLAAMVAKEAEQETAAE